MIGKIVFVDLVIIHVVMENKDVEVISFREQEFMFTNLPNGTF